jgi:hypothetical protein
MAPGSSRVLAVIIHSASPCVGELRDAPARSYPAEVARMAEDRLDDRCHCNREYTKAATTTRRAMTADEAADTAASAILIGRAHKKEDPRA